MGVSLTWVAVKGLPLDEVLSRLELAATGATCDYPIDDLACHALPDGAWLIVANGCGHRIGDDDSMARLSPGADALCCNVEEHVAFASCADWRDGRCGWLVSYAGAEGEDDLQWEGEPPARFHALFAGVSLEDNGDPDIYYHMDIPLILAHEIGGYRHDALDPVLDAEPFEVLRDLRPKTPWWRKLWS